MHVSRHNKKQLFIAKLDTEKTFDRVRWKFLEALMQTMGFRTLIKSNMACLSSTRMHFITNNLSSSTAIQTNGVHQGDPLFFFLVYLCANVFIFYD